MLSRPILSLTIMNQNYQILTQAYEEHGEALFRFCFFKVSNRDKAVDIVQETFTKVWQYLVNGNTIDDIKPFLYTTARHLVIDEYRKKKSVSLDALLDLGMEPSISIEEKIFTSDDASRAMECVNQLPEAYSSVIIMRYVNDFSVQDIARIVHKSENVISVRIHRGLSKLRLLMSA